MNGTAPELARKGEPVEVTRLQESFRVFNQVTRQLEQAYARLEQRTAGFDSRLHEANHRLRGKVDELKRVTAELHGILDAIPCGVVTCDGEGTITRLNPAAERIIGRPAAEMRGRDARTLLDHEGRPILLLGRSSVEAGTVVERLVCSLEGSERFLSGSVADLPDGGRIEILADQTEVVHLRSQVNRLDTLAELGEMAAGVAHEVRNPMNAVEGFAGLLEKALRASEDGEVDTDRLLRYTDRIRKGVSEVDGIIRNLLLWASPERARHDPVDLPRLLAEVVSEALGPGRVPGARRVDLEKADAGIQIRGDRLKLKLAFANLVRNAQEAAGPDGRVRILCRASAERVEVRVDDDGPGIPSSVRGRIFRPFTTTKPEGTGLGLALARKFVELHGGRVAAGDGDLGGASFLVSLPHVRTGVLA